MDDRRIRATCGCGWQVDGAEDEVVAATIDHGSRIHNMVATAEQVLERAEVLEDDADLAG